jgi:hypothetical protein
MTTPDTTPEAVERLANSYVLPGMPEDCRPVVTAATLRALAAENAALRADNDRLRGAITPSGDTKAAYMGEIKDPETKRYVSWTAIKMIMAMIAARAALDAKP